MAGGRWAYGSTGSVGPRTRFAEEFTPETRRIASIPPVEPHHCRPAAFHTEAGPGRGGLRGAGCGGVRRGGGRGGVLLADVRAITFATLGVLPRGSVSAETRL